MVLLIVFFAAWPALADAGSGTLMYSHSHSQAIGIRGVDQGRYEIDLCQFGEAEDPLRFEALSLSKCRVLTRRILGRTQIDQLLEQMAVRVEEKLRWADYNRFMTLNLAGFALMIAGNAIYGPLRAKLFHVKPVTDHLRQAIGAVEMGSGLVIAPAATYLYIKLLGRAKNLEAILAALNNRSEDGRKSMDVSHKSWPMVVQTVTRAIAHFERSQGLTQTAVELLE